MRCFHGYLMYKKSLPSREKRGNGETGTSILGSAAWQGAHKSINIGDLQVWQSLGAVHDIVLMYWSYLRLPVTVCINGMSY
ncbi:hypothetical protein XELAEV_18023919mg [Xenopus laevis]|uniref:Uncharacterized protein n=1 Tax=Xenopus laevis TaxID=8355 RepID=A0A974D5X1_XENLA|nr:hypothetical protein XELAEV_18023919mg [Xenopus laevis]